MTRRKGENSLRVTTDRAWRANRDAVNQLLRAWGYPGIPLEEPKPKTAFKDDYEPIVVECDNEE